MAVNVISTEKAPGAVGPYSQAIQAGDFLFASGQIAIDPEKGKVVGGGVVNQAEQCMKNVGAILAAAGASYDGVHYQYEFLRRCKRSIWQVFPENAAGPFLRRSSFLTEGCVG